MRSEPAFTSEVTAPATSPPQHWRVLFHLTEQVELDDEDGKPMTPPQYAGPGDWLNPKVWPSREIAEEKGREYMEEAASFSGFPVLTYRGVVRVHGDGDE